MMYGRTLILIASIIIVAGVFGTSGIDLFATAGVAIACAVAGYGVMKARVWAKWLAMALGPLMVLGGAAVLWISNRPVTVLEYVMAVVFAAAWVWDAHRRLAPSRADAA